MDSSFAAGVARPGPAGHPRWEEPWSPEGLVHGVRLSFVDVVQQERGPAPVHRQRHGLIRPRHLEERLEIIGGGDKVRRGGAASARGLVGGEEPVRLPRGDEAGRWRVGGVPRGLVQVRARGWGVPSRGHEIERVGVAASVGIRRGRRRGRRRGGREEVEGRHARQPGMRLREEGGGVTAPVHRAPGRGRRRQSGTSLPRTLRHADFPSPFAANKGEKLCCQTVLPSLSSSASTSTMILP